MPRRTAASVSVPVRVPVRGRGVPVLALVAAGFAQVDDLARDGGRGGAGRGSGVRALGGGAVVRAAVTGGAAKVAAPAPVVLLFGGA
ncbi:hypothetical protein LUW77_18225 [Streptomyces radiopugnans]|nr:hypothetical protein LUW77_18225 [Streptomyces radiopugnans]